jgi:hypothetical protein
MSRRCARARAAPARGIADSRGEGSRSFQESAKAGKVSSGSAIEFVPLSLCVGGQHEVIAIRKHAECGVGDMRDDKCGEVRARFLDGSIDDRTLLSGRSDFESLAACAGGRACHGFLECSK